MLFLMEQSMQISEVRSFLMQYPAGQEVFFSFEMQQGRDCFQS